MSVEEWDSFLDEREFKDISEELPSGFLLGFQIFEGLIKYKGDKYRCIGWHPPGGPPYVAVEKYDQGP